MACRRCGRHREQLPFLTGEAHHTARFDAAVGQACTTAPVRRVAVQSSLSVETVRLIY